MQELERTYLAKEFPADLKSFPWKELLDIYVPSTSEHPGLRIRKRGDVYEITKKRPVADGDASHQTEDTILLSPEEYAELSQLGGKRVGKTRYYYKDGGVDYEIDIFTGDLSGLVLVDVEFGSIEEKDAFTAPSFCLAEVTHELFVAGGMICGKTYADIEKDLARFNYAQLSVS